VLPHHLAALVPGDLFRGAGFLCVDGECLRRPDDSRGRPVQDVLQSHLRPGDLQRRFRSGGGHGRGSAFRIPGPGGGPAARLEKDGRPMSRAPKARRRPSSFALVGGTLVCLVSAFLVLPLVVIVLSSFGTDAYLAFPPSGFTLAWYRQLLGLR